MAGGTADPDLFTQLALLSHVGTVGDLTDGQLVTRFLTARDGSAQAVFTVLVERHGPMVLRVCRQVLGDSHDAQDAFQATFLVLAKKIGSVRKTDSVASWLYGVALRVAARARADAAQRRVHERRGAAMREPETERPSWPELHEEIARLPERYREPLVLCYFEGLSTEAAALRIGCPKGTVLSRLGRGREQLRRRLVRRGVASAAVLTAMAPAAEATTLPSTLLESTVKAALGFAGRDATNAAVASAAATTLAREVLFTMSLSKLKLLGLSLLASALTIGGAEGLAYQFGAAAGEQVEKAAAAEDRQAALGRAVDRLQRELDDATRRNTELNRQMLQLQRELDDLKKSALAGAGPPKRPITATKEEMTTKGAVLPGSRGGGIPAGTMPGTFAPGSFAGGGFRGGRMLPGRFGSNSFSNDPTKPTAIQSGPLMVVMGPERERLVLYNTLTKHASAFSMTGKKGEEPAKLIPISGQGVVTVWVKAPHVTQIAAAAEREGVWHVQDLREPVSEQATPMIGHNMAVFSLGRYIYAFSAVKKQWGVIARPDGADGPPTIDTQFIKAEGGGHILTFSVTTAEWSDLDLNKILKSGEDEIAKEADPSK